MEIKQEVIFDSGNKYGCISVCKQHYIEVNGERTYIGLPERRAFSPDQISELREYAPELESICEAMWTPEVIVKWQESQLVNL